MEGVKDRSRITDKAFWIGFSIGCLVFVGAQLVSFNIEYAKFLAREQELSEMGISFSVGGYSWGFPFKMYMNFWGFPNNVGFDLLPTAINIIIAAAFAGAVGIVFQAARDRFWKA